MRRGFFEEVLGRVGEIAWLDGAGREWEVVWMTEIGSVMWVLTEGLPKQGPVIRANPAGSNPIKPNQT